MPPPTQGKRRRVQDEEEDDEPRRRQSRRQDDSEDNDDFDEDVDGDVEMGGANFSDEAQLVKKLVRYALACEHSRTPIRRDGIREKVLGNHARMFKRVFDGAQVHLRQVFGMEMTELPLKEKRTLKEKQSMPLQPPVIDSLEMDYLHITQQRQMLRREMRRRRMQRLQRHRRHTSSFPSSPDRTSRPPSSLPRDCRAPARKPSLSGSTALSLP
jgi:hypothetical protein